MRINKIIYLGMTIGICLMAAGCKETGNSSEPGTSQTATHAAVETPFVSPAPDASASSSTGVETDITSIEFDTASIIVSPDGSTKAVVTGWNDSKEQIELKNSGLIQFTSDRPGIVDVAADGTITTGPKGWTGDLANVTASVGQATATVQVTIKYALEDTVETVGGKAVVTNREDRAVVVNKKRALPDNYKPADLVEPNVPFSFKEQNEKRKLRKEAAEALEQLFELADEEGVKLFGVSGFRSYGTQRSIYNANVKSQGEAEASRVSAKPGHSEHQTGLAIDVSSASAGYALEESFGNTPEGKWLAENAHKAGFIIRYPKGKESITGYRYEPWHIRYVGQTIAEHIHRHHMTLEEYFEDAVPVNG